MSPLINCKKIAKIILEKKDSILGISEALLQYNRKTEKSYVEVMTSDQKFEKRDVKVGITDGINVEIISGVKIDDKHIEVIVRQMMQKVSIDDAGDSNFLPKDRINRAEFFETNEKLTSMVVITDPGDSEG